MFVLLYQAVSRRDNVLRRAVVLLQLEKFALRIIVAEIQDVLDFGATERVDALRIVAHHANILVLLRQLFDNQILRIIGILILIDQNITETLLIFVENVGVVAE